MEQGGFFAAVAVLKGQLPEEEEEAEEEKQEEEGSGKMEDRKCVRTRCADGMREKNTGGAFVSGDTEVKHS